MANHRADNVEFIDTDNTALDRQIRIRGVKYIGTTAGTITIRTGITAGGNILWQASGNVETFDNVIIQAQDGIFVDVVSNASVFLYSVDR